MAYFSFETPDRKNFALRFFKYGARADNKHLQNNPAMAVGADLSWPAPIMNFHKIIRQWP
jgi:hypothetical protein